MQEPSGRMRSAFFVICECGVTKVMQKQVLMRSSTISCGCYSKSLRYKHGNCTGGKNSITYRSWSAMKTRCYNIEDKNYPGYGGSGIVVCAEWLKNFENFLKDMGEAPDGMTLNRRIDPQTKEPYKIYSKGTCEWTNKSVQSFDQKRCSRNTSGRTGVSRDKVSGKWCAYIGYNGIYKHLGTFADYEDAVSARINAEMIYYGYEKK